MSVAARLQKIRERVAKVSGGRKVNILAVSKAQPISKIREAYDAGQTLFAENYVQEVGEKLDQLRNLPVEWHFIGRIQSNKLKNLVGKFKAIHSIDRLSLATTLNSLSKTRQDIFLQYNVASEASKGGADETAVEELAGAIAKMPNLRVLGLMVMPPLFENPEDVRPYFKKARALNDKLGFNELSMGTSSDFEIAIEEGATFVRVGTDIFGSRSKE